mmetsp:Transcript_2388/g.6610  ORF Transcript_2388/g.6610 Transcript_2388/m.6610 type:complete len:237 (+) Transcript_2388:1143-1853(+)
MALRSCNQSFSLGCSNETLFLIWMTKAKSPPAPPPPAAFVLLRYILEDGRIESVWLKKDSVANTVCNKCNDPQCFTCAGRSLSSLCRWLICNTRQWVLPLLLLLPSSISALNGNSVWTNASMETVPSSPTAFCVMLAALVISSMMLCVVDGVELRAQLPPLTGATTAIVLRFVATCFAASMLLMLSAVYISLGSMTSNGLEWRMWLAALKKWTTIVLMASLCCFCWYVCVCVSCAG